MIINVIGNIDKEGAKTEDFLLNCLKYSQCCLFVCLKSGVKISKNSQGHLGPLCHIFEGPHNCLRAEIYFFVNETYNVITVASKSAGPAGPPNVNF